MPPTSTVVGADETVNVTAKGMGNERSELEEAEAIIRDNTQKTKVTFHPTMLGLSAPFTTVRENEEHEEEGGDEGEEDEGEMGIQFNIADCNHNMPNSNKCYEIMNNILNNVMGGVVDHEQSLGSDGQMLVMYWDKVRWQRGCQSVWKLQQQPSQFIYKILKKLSILTPLQEDDLANVSKSKKASLRPMVRDYDDTSNPIPVATIAPSDEACIGDWYQQWLDRGGDQYLLNDLRTEEGRLKVIQYNNFTDEWDKDEEMASEDTTVDQKIAWIVKMIAKKKMSANIYHSPIEMMHRQIAVTHVMTASTVNHYTAGLVTSSLMVDNFVDTGIAITKMPTADAFDKRLTEVLTPNSKRVGMMDEYVTVTVYYVTNHEVNVEELLNAMRIKSRHISDSKINSARPSAGSQIGAYGKQFMLSMNIDAITYKPDTSCFTCPLQIRLSKKAATKVFNDSEKDEEKAWGVCQLLTMEVMKEYIRDPLNDKLLKQVKNLLACPREGASDQDGRLTPPYYLDFERIARQPGTLDGGYNVSGEIANEFILCPIFMLYLYADRKNITPREAAGKEKLVKLIDYTMRFHLGAETGHTNLTKIHGAFSGQYEFTYQDQNHIYEEWEGLIGACVMCINMFNACLASASYKEGLTPEERLKKVKAAAHLFNGAFQTLDSAAGNPSIVSTTHHLGK